VLTLSTGKRGTEAPCATGEGGAAERAPLRKPGRKGLAMSRKKVGSEGAPLEEEGRRRRERRWRRGVGAGGRSLREDLW
jgi:hypothetical protein